MPRKSNLHIYIIIALLSAVLSACSTTRRIPEDDYLYVGTAPLRYEGDRGAKAVPADIRLAIEEAVMVEPNNYWSLVGWRYPFPLGLWAYNNWPNDKGGFRGWLYNTFATDPVLISSVRPEARTRMIEQQLANNGFFRASASFELEHQKNKRKVKVYYTINPGPAYNISRVELPADTTRLIHLIDSIALRDPYLQPGNRFATDSLDYVRNRITNSLRDRGYYFFRPEYIKYQADSVAVPGEVALRLRLDSDIPSYATAEYVTGHTTVTVNRYRGHQTPDTIELRKDLTLVQMLPSKLRQQLISECVTFREGRTFAVRNMNRTQNYLSRTGIFRQVSISVAIDSTAERPTLRPIVSCTFEAPLTASIEVNASSKSNSYIGPGIVLGLTHNNLFGGGEQLSINLNGAYEWQTGGGRGIFNSYEAGLTTTLSIPRLLAPKFIPRSTRRELSWTRFQIGADLLNRPHYFKMAQFNTSVSYDWRWRRHVSNSFTPLKLTYTKLMNTTAEFDEVMAENPAVAQSFENQFIPQMIYSYTYDRQFSPSNALNFQLTLQEAGNVFWGIYELAGSKGEKHLFGTPFSQFVKANAQVVWNHRLMPGHNIVSRVAIGAAEAYGNSSQVPYAEQFYVGGANSVRGFTVRSIGPGSFRRATDDPNAYFDQTGTFKFEANVEYRMQLSGALYGALFLDAGNVWLLHRDEARPGGTLTAGNFLRDLATGTGLGLRFDMGMLVVRGDLGIALHAPYDTGHSGYFNLPSFSKSLAFHLAIGYPF